MKLRITQINRSSVFCLPTIIPLLLAKTHTHTHIWMRARTHDFFFTLAIAANVMSVLRMDVSNFFLSILSLTFSLVCASASAYATLKATNNMMLYILYTEKENWFFSTFSARTIITVMRSASIRRLHFGTTRIGAVCRYFVPSSIHLCGHCAFHLCVSISVSAGILCCECKN